MTSADNLPSCYWTLWAEGGKPHALIRDDGIYSLLLFSTPEGAEAIAKTGLFANSELRYFLLDDLFRYLDPHFPKRMWRLFCLDPRPEQIDGDEVDAYHEPLTDARLRGSIR